MPVINYVGEQNACDHQLIWIWIMNMNMSNIIFVSNFTG